MVAMLHEDAHGDSRLLIQGPRDEPGVVAQTHGDVLFSFILFLPGEAHVLRGTCLTDYIHALEVGFVSGSGGGRRPFLDALAHSPADDLESARARKGI